jgi:DNA-binding transcriptional MerR regulator
VESRSTTGGPREHGGGASASLPVEAPERYAYRMRELVARTGLSAATIHFYRLQGLLPPARKTSDNQARYGEETLGRLRWIRALQSELRLPLRAIGAILERWGEVPLDDLRARQALGRLLDDPDPPAPREALAAVVSRLEPTDMASLARAGLVRRLPDGGIPARDLRLLELCASMREAGFTEAAGFGIDQLRVYREATERLVGEELSRIIEPILHRQDPAAVRDLVRRGLPLANRLLSLLHERAVQEELERWLELGATEQETDRESA